MCKNEFPAFSKENKYVFIQNPSILIPVGKKMADSVGNKVS